MGFAGASRPTGDHHDRGDDGDPGDDVDGDDERGDGGPVADRHAGAATPDGDELARALQRLAAETRVDDAVASRRRTSSLSRQAEEEATLGGVLLDLAERERPIALQTSSGRAYRGWITAVGADFVAIRTAIDTDALLRFDAIATVRGQRGDPVTVGHRPLAIEASFLVAVRSLGPRRPRVVLVTAGAEVVIGELRWVGADVAAVRPDGGGSLTYVPLAALHEVTMPDRLSD